jgi:hypothetical protein
VRDRRGAKTRCGQQTGKNAAAQAD